MIASDVIRALAVLIPLGIQRPDQLGIFYIAGFIMTTMSLLFNPARDAVIPNILDEEMLLTANAMIQANQILGMVFGSAIAGLVIGSFGIASAFILDSMTFIISAIAIATMNIPPLTSSSVKVNAKVIWRELNEGLTFIRQNASLLSIVIITGVATLGLATIMVLGIVYLDEELGVKAQGFGFVNSVQGLGVVIGGLCVGRLMHSVPHNRIVGTCMFILGLAVIVFAFAPNYPLVLVACSFIGFCIVFARASLATLTQILVPDEKRGRVGSAVNVVIAMSGTTSMVLAGLLGDLVGVRVVFLMAGLVTLASGAAAFVTLREPSEIVRGKRLAANPDVNEENLG